MLLALILQITPQGWELTATLPGPDRDSNFGSAVCVVDDLSGDDISDIVVAAPSAEYMGGALAGRVDVYSGDTQALLYSLYGAAGSGFGAVLESVGDLDLDGFGDFLASSWNAVNAQVLAVSGRDGIPIYVLDGRHRYDRFGERMTRIGDLDRDGITDFAISANSYSEPGLLEMGLVICYSGASGSILFEKKGSGERQHFGHGLKGGGDIDGDGVPDLLVHNTLLLRDIHAFSGATQKRLYTMHGFYEEFLNHEMEFVADVDGDGCDEIVLGARVTYGNHDGCVSLRSGRTGERIWKRVREGWSNAYGRRLQTLGDLTGDGFDEILVSASDDGPWTRGGRGRLYILSSRTGEHLAFFDAPASPPGSTSFPGFGSDLALLPDSTGPGYPGLVVGASAGGSLGNKDVGEVYLYKPELLLFSSVDQVSAAAGSAVVFKLDFPESAYSDPYRILLSSGASGGFAAGSVEIPLVPNATFTSFLRDPPPSFTGATGTLDSWGKATATWIIAPGTLAAWVGHTVKVAAVSLDPNRQPAVVSWARAIQILP